MVYLVLADVGPCTIINNSKTKCDHTDGEYTTLRAEAIVRLPTNLDKAEMAPLLCAGVTVFNGIRKMNIEQGGLVAVQGLGGLGHLAIQYARKMGYRTVALSSSNSKRAFAMELGATDYVDGSKENTTEALQKMGGADLLVVTAPNPKVCRSDQCHDCP
jgi:D-arabinose 1-dehydrogenase-like Zn-dependent alcohol dehydrogenase